MCGKEAQHAQEGTQRQLGVGATHAGKGPGRLDFSRVQPPLSPLQRILLYCEAAGACAGPPQAAAGLLSQARSLLQVRSP